MTFFALALVFLTVGGLSFAAVVAFCWAGSSGQFHNIEKGALSVFDADEVARLHPDSLQEDGKTQEKTQTRA